MEEKLGDLTRIVGTWVWDQDSSVMRFEESKKWIRNLSITFGADGSFFQSHMKLRGTYKVEGNLVYVDVKTILGVSITFDSEPYVLSDDSAMLTLCESREVRARSKPKANVVFVFRRAHA